MATHSIIFYYSFLTLSKVLTKLIPPCPPNINIYNLKLEKDNETNSSLDMLG